MHRNLRRLFFYSAIIINICSCGTLHHALNNADTYYSKIDERLSLKGNVAEATVLITPYESKKLKPDFGYQRHFFFLYDTGATEERWVKESLAIVDLNRIDKEETIRLKFNYTPEKQSGWLLMQDSVYKPGTSKNKLG